NVEAGSVAVGSAYHKWAITAPFTKRTGIGFKDVYKHCQEGTMKELAKKAPLHNVVLNMVIRHLPNPLEAQKIRVPVIWRGDPESPVGKAMLNVDENGPVGFMVTRIIVDPQAAEVAAGRLFSCKISRGQELSSAGEAKPTSDLATLVQGLWILAKADTSIQIESNQEPGEHLISGMGELHLEITIYRVQNDYKIPVTTSPPIVVYREGVRGAGGP